MGVPALPERLGGNKSAAKFAAKPEKTVGQRGPGGSMTSRDLNSRAPVWGILEHASTALRPSSKRLLRQLPKFSAPLPQASQELPRLGGADQSVWLNRLEEDYDNLVAGLSLFTSSSETERATQFGIGLWQFWWLKGTYSEARAHQEAVTALPAAPGSEPARADLLSRVAEFARLQGDFEHARKYHEQSLAISRSLGDRTRVTAQLREIGRLALIEGHFDVARRVLDEALTLHRALNDRHGLALVLSFTAELDFVQGDIDSGSAHLTQALELQRIFDDRSGMAVTLQLLGHAACEQGDWHGAELLLRDSLELFQQAGPSWGVAWGLEGFALLAAARGQAVRALRLAGGAAARREVLGLTSTPLARDIFESKLAAARLDLTEEAAAEAWATGHAMNEEQILSYVRRADEPIQLPAARVLASSARPATP